ncbi:hypothetical protein [Clostridium sp. DL1XJH146]
MDKQNIQSIVESMPSLSIENSKSKFNDAVEGVCALLRFLVQIDKYLNLNNIDH